MEDKNSLTQIERSALTVGTLTSFMGPFMISSVNVALPAIQAELKMNAVELSWIATAYLLSVAVGLVPAGKIADIYGRKKVFATGIAVYTLASFAAALTTTTFQMIGCRLLQGFGAAMFVTTGMAILSSVFAPHKRGRAIGVYVAAVYIGLSVGPFVGGLLTQYFGWRSIFFIMLPMGMFSLAVTLYYLKGEWLGEPGQRFDVVGCLIYGISILSLVYGATRLPESIGIVLVLCGIALFVLFVFHQLQARYPVFEITLFFTNRTFTFSSLAALLNYSATFGITFLLSLYLQYLQGLTPQSAGMVLMAQPVMMALISPYAGRLSDRVEPRLLASFGMTMTVIGVVNFAFLTPETSITLIVLNLIFLGSGFALFSSPNMNAIMGAVEKKYYGQASGAVSTMRLLGQMFSMATATAVLSVMLGRSPITPENYEEFLSCIQVVFMLSAALCTIGIYFSWFRGRMNS